MLGDVAGPELLAGEQMDIGRMVEDVLGYLPLGALVRRPGCGIIIAGSPPVACIPADRRNLILRAIPCPRVGIEMSDTAKSEPLACLSIEPTLASRDPFRVLFVHGGLGVLGQVYNQAGHAQPDQSEDEKDGEPFSTRCPHERDGG